MKKSVAKRIKVTKTGKLLRRPMAVDHFRAKKTGQGLLAKKRKKEISKNYQKEIKRLLANNK